MRLMTLALSALLLAVLPASAQLPTAPAPGAPNPADQRLDQYLKNWELAMEKIQTLAARLERTEKDTTFNTNQKFVGYAQYMKAGSGKSVQNLASLEMRQDGKATEIAEKFVCTGAFLYQFSPAKKEIHAFALPEPKVGQVAEDNFLTFLFGMKAQEARRRYDMKLVNEDKDYIYVMIMPRFPQDKADFQRARVVLNKDSYLPRQLWFEQPNGSDVTWEVPAIRAGVQVNRADFDAPTPPRDWKMVQMPRNNDIPPKVIRPSGQ